MVQVEQLNQQSHDLTELSNVLNHLLADRSLCDNRVTCDLFFKFTDMLKGHLELADREVYKNLLACSDHDARNTAHNFMSGSIELKRVFANYMKHWCNKQTQSLRIRDYETFVKETHDMFELFHQRIQDETEKLYPIYRKITSESQTSR